MKLPVLRASATERWMNCTWFSSHEWPEGQSSEAAERGRRVHAGIAKALGCKSDEPMPVSDDERGLVDIGVTYAKHLMDQAIDWTVHVEQSMELGLGTDSFKGTADLVLVNGQRAVLVDWKTGQRHSGYEPQMLTYAYLLSRILGVTQVDVRLVYLASGEEDQMSISSEQIEQHAAAILVASSRRTEETPMASPGPWCQWCPAAIDCPKNAAMAPALTTLSKVDVDPRALVASVNTEEEAQLAHALIQYASEVLSKVEGNLKQYVRANGALTTWEGQRYSPMTKTKRSFELTPAAMDVIAKHGAEGVVRPHATLTELAKAVSGKAAKAALEADLEACGAITTTTYESWTTK